MVPYEPSPASGISIKFEDVIYTWPGDHEIIPFAYYDSGDPGSIENLGPLDLEMSTNGEEVYLDGVSERAERIFHELGGSAWAAIAYEMQGHIPLGKNFHTPGRIY